MEVLVLAGCAILGLCLGYFVLFPLLAWIEGQLH